jgi:hypothetical protein
MLIDILVWFISVIACAWVYRALSGGTLGISRLNFFSVLFWIAFIVLTLPGTLLVALGAADDLFFVAPIASESAIKRLGLYVICWTAICVPLASLAVFSCLGASPKKSWALFEQRNLSAGEGNHWGDWRLTLITLAFVYLVLFSIVQFQTYPSPLLLSLTGAGDLEIAQRRIDVTRLYDGSRSVKSFLNLVGPVLLFSCMTLRAVDPTVGRLFWAVGLLVIVSALTDSEKAPLISILVGGFLTTIYLGRKARIAVVMALLLAVIASVVGMYVIFYSDVVSSGFLIERLIERIFVAQMASVPLSFAEYPSQHPFIGLESINSIFHQVFDVLPAPRASEHLLVRYFPVLSDAGAWNINGLFIHEAWANFGWGGLILAPIYVGIIHSLIVLVFWRIPKTPLNVALFAYVSSDVTLFITGFNGYIFNTGVMHFIALVLIVNVFLIVFRSFRKFRNVPLDPFRSKMRQN